LCRYDPIAFRRDRIALAGKYRRRHDQGSRHDDAGNNQRDKFRGQSRGAHRGTRSRSPVRARLKKTIMRQWCHFARTSR
jgi:hypothetical protein